MAEATHEHLCPSCGIRWEHGMLDCSTGTTFLLDCPNEAPRAGSILAEAMRLGGRIADHTQFGHEGWAVPAQTVSVKPVTKVAWWRWLLIPVAAILGFIVAQLLALLPGIILPDRGAQLVSSFMTPVGFVVLGTWVVPVKRTQVAGALASIMLVFHGMFSGATLFSGWYETRDIVFNSGAFVIGITGSVLGFFIARGTGIRKKIGVALASILAVYSNVVPVVIFVGIATGIWWPIIQTILEAPGWTLLLIPLGFLLTGFAALIQGLISAILVLPLVALTAWLLKESE